MNVVLIQPILRAFDDRHNLETIGSLVRSAAGRTSRDDILLLPEHFTSESDPETYVEYIRSLALMSGCTVVGGSHHRLGAGQKINTGTVISPEGKLLGTYTKLRPYFNELKHVVPGDVFGEFEINGLRVLVFVCADFWYSDLLLRATVQPDLILVPSLSVSRKPSPVYSRELWHHLAITRAYEFGACIGISDWHENSVLPSYRTCSVGGFA